MEFESVMKNNTDEMLISVLRQRENYQPEAVSAAIAEATARGILKEGDDLDTLFPALNSETKRSALIDKEHIEFNHHKVMFYVLGGGTLLLFLVRIKYGLPVIPLIYLYLVYACSKEYNKLYETIISWITAGFFVTWTLVVILLLARIFA